MNNPYPPEVGQASQSANHMPPVQIQFPHRRPLVTYTVLILSIVVYLIQYVSQSTLGGDIASYYGLKVNSLIVQGQYWRLLTPMFLHGSIIHLGVNMYALYLFGPGLESQYGHRRFLLLYLLSGYAGNVMSFLFSIANSLGSSTAIFGLLGAEGVFIYQNRRLLGARAQRALTEIIVIALINFVIGLSPGIDNWGHLGGLLGGVLFAWFGGPLLEVEGIYPNLMVVDRRERSDVIRSAVGVLVLFTLLAAVTIYFRSR